MIDPTDKAIGRGGGKCFCFLLLKSMFPNNFTVHSFIFEEEHIMLKLVFHSPWIDKKKREILILNHYTKGAVFTNAPHCSATYSKYQNYWIRELGIGIYRIRTIRMWHHYSTAVTSLTHIYLLCPAPNIPHSLVLRVDSSSRRGNFSGDRGNVKRPIATW